MVTFIFLMEPVGFNESKGVVAYEHSNDAMYFSTDQVARLRIDSSGRVLIGTSTEGHENANTLTLSNSGTAGMTIRSTSSNCHIYFSDATSGAGEYVGQLGYNMEVIICSSILVVQKDFVLIQVELQ